MCACVRVCVCTRARVYVYMKYMPWNVKQSHEIDTGIKGKIPYRSSLIWCQGRRICFSFYTNEVRGILLVGVTANFLLGQMG